MSKVIDYIGWQPWQHLGQYSSSSNLSKIRSSNPAYSPLAQCQSFSISLLFLYLLLSWMHMLSNNLIVRLSPLKQKCCACDIVFCNSSGLRWLSLGIKYDFCGEIARDSKFEPNHEWLPKNCKAPFATLTSYSPFFGLRYIKRRWGSKKQETVPTISEGKSSERVEISQNHSFLLNQEYEREGPSA